MGGSNVGFISSHSLSSLTGTLPWAEGVLEQRLLTPATQTAAALLATGEADIMAGKWKCSTWFLLSRFLGKILTTQQETIHLESV